MLIATPPYYDHEPYFKDRIEAVYKMPEKAVKDDKIFPFVNVSESILQYNAKGLFSLSSFIKKESFDQRWVVVYNDFIDKLLKKRALFKDIPQEIIKRSISESLGKILNLSPDIISVGISDEDECVFIYTEFGNKSSFFNVFFSESDIEVLLNIIDGEEPVLSYNGDVQSSISEFEKNMVKNYDEHTYFRVSY